MNTVTEKEARTVPRYLKVIAGFAVAVVGFIVFNFLAALAVILWGHHIGAALDATFDAARWLVGQMP